MVARVFELVEFEDSEARPKVAKESSTFPTEEEQNLATNKKKCLGIYLHVSVSVLCAPISVSVLCDTAVSLVFFFSIL